MVNKGEARFPPAPPLSLAPPALMFFLAPPPDDRNTRPVQKLISKNYSKYLRHYIQYVLVVD